MKRLPANLAIVLGVALFSTMALADDDYKHHRYGQHAEKHHGRDDRHHEHYDYAKVIHVESIVRLDRVPAWHRKCWQGYTEHHACKAIRDYHVKRHLEGYRVTYRYQGHDYVTRVDHHPGKRIKVKVNATPVYY